MNAEEQLGLCIVKTDSKTVLSLQTFKSLRIIQILNKVKSQKQHSVIEDKIHHQTIRLDKSEILKKLARIVMKNHPPIS